MTGHVIVHEPGTYSGVLYDAPLVDGKYVTTYWGSIEEQVAEAQAKNLERHSSIRHVQMDLWTFVHDCPHTNPEEDEKYDGLDDLLDEWMAEHYPDLVEYKRETFDARWKAQREGMAAIPLYVEFHAEMGEYEEYHDSSVCRLSPQGSTCLHPDCVEGDEDGYEPMPCRRQENAREEWDEFWSEYGALD